MSNSSYVSKNPDHVFLVDEKIAGSTLEVKKGEFFTINLRNPGSGGYLVKDPEFDKTILQLRDEKSIPPPEDSRKAGDFGRLLYSFTAIAPGSTEIILKIYRPWEKNVPAQEYVRINVVVAR